MNGEIEDEAHFVMNCNVYDDLRAKMLDAVSSALSKEGVEVEEAMKSEEGRKKIMTALMGELFSSNSELRAAALHFCKRAMRRRNEIVRTILDQRT